MKRAAWVTVMVMAMAGWLMAQKFGGTSGASGSGRGTFTAGTATGGTVTPNAPAGITTTPTATPGQPNLGMPNPNLGAQIPSPNNTIAPAMTVPGSVPTPSNGSVPFGSTPTLQTGFLGGGGGGGGVGGAPLINTPSIDIGGVVAPAPVGASNATAGLTAGASNATLSMGQVPTGSVMTIPVTTFNAGGVAVAVNPNAGAPSSAVNIVPVLPGGGVFNTGSAQFSSIYDTGPAVDPHELGAIARAYRQRRATENARLYTNQDLDRLAPSATGFETSNAGVGGQNASAYMAGAQASQAPQPTTPVIAGGATMAGAQPGAAMPQSSGATTPAAPAGAQAQQAPPQTQPPAQATQPAPQNQNRTQNKQLPATGSLLPLLAIIGSMLGAGGLFYRLRK